MAVNTELQGAEYRLPQPYVVSREAIAEFARATGAEHPAHTDIDAAREAGYADRSSPATNSNASPTSTACAKPAVTP